MEKSKFGKIFAVLPSKRRENPQIAMNNIKIK